MVSLKHATRVLHNESICVRLAFNRDTSAVVTVSDCIDNGFVNHSRGKLWFINKAASRLALLVFFEEGRFSKESASLPNLFRKWACELLLEIGSPRAWNWSEETPKRSERET